MLTNIFYYGYYKPYIIRNAEPNSDISARRPKITEKRNLDLIRNQSFILNKSLRYDIINYAKDVSTGVLDVKDSAKYLMQNLDEFNNNVSRDGIDAAREWINEDLTQFVEAYNKAVDFMSRQTHSYGLKEFSNELSNTVIYNQESLANLGINIGSDGKLSLDKDVLKDMGAESINTAIGENYDVFNSIYKDSTGMLLYPLAEHMNFRALNYHYNYKLGKVVTDGFDMIETGLLIDKTV